ncbi:MAG: hypothetical protein EG823_03710 [Actinobacteria bacterium]|nr:hypothetical protein [Actinomycetota bacterium]
MSGRACVIDDRVTFSEVCSRCVHFSPIVGLEWHCDAFDRVPDAIWDGKNDHTAEYPGDHGIRFEPRVPVGEV